MHYEISKQRRLISDNERGVVLVMSLMMMILITVLGVAVINLSGTEMQTASFEKISARAFSSAESGMTQARNDLQTFVLAPPQNGQWPSTDQAAITGVMGLTPSKVYNLSVSGTPISFSYVITEFGSTIDRTVLIRSTGTSRNTQQVIEAIFRYEPPSEVGSQECYNAKCTSVDKSSGSAVNFTGSANSTANL